MKIKLTVSGPQADDQDVLLTADITATIGEICHTILAGNPSISRDDVRFAANDDHPVALRVRYPNDERTYVLDALATLAESGLQSGCWVEAVDATTVGIDDIPLYRRIAIARVISGRQTGSEFDLVAGGNLIGRGRSCRVLLTDNKVSRRHAVLELGGKMTITDLRSGNGVYLDGVEIQTAPVADGAVITVGGTQLRIRVLPATIASPALNVPPTFVEFVRPPRVDAHYLTKSLAAPAPPPRGEPNKFPIIAIVAPLIMGVVLFMTSGSPLSLIFVALSPIIMIGTYIDSRVSGRRKTRESVAQFDVALRALQEKAKTEIALESASRTVESPSTADAQSAMVDRSSLLWTRRPEHQTFLEVRLGLGSQRSRVRIEVPARNNAAESFWDRLESVIEENKTVEPVPVLETFERAGNIGVAGNRIWSDGVMRSLVVQLCGLHSPADLVVACFAEEDNVDDWQWLKWLPHVGSIYSPIDSGHLAGDRSTSGQLMAQLEGVLDARKASPSTGATEVRSHLSGDHTIDDLHGTAVTSLPVTPTIIVVVTSDTEVDRGRLVSLAEEGPDFGIHLIWHAPEVSDIPAVCRTFIDVHPQLKATVGFVRSAVSVTLDPVETLEMAAATIAARRLAPVLDSGAPVLDESDLPSSVAYPDLRVENVISSAPAVAALWENNQSLTARWSFEPPREIARLSALVGQGVAGVLRLDLREHGPHALVGGTTGSGKSEFLQSWIMSLASEYSPDRLTFLLVDYKGGAAFAECTDLPHTVGLVTDLNTHLVRRALTSLRAELRYRETLLNEKGAKDLMTLERRADPDAPPSLVIVIDEFAALVGEVPEFIDGIVDVAQRGRSLGLHLIMATQRPAGVIKDNLRANTNLRIALRVADESDSQDVIGVKDAAGFNAATPGRGAAKLGPGKLIHFQTGYLGGHSQSAVASPNIEIENFPFELRGTWNSGRPSTGVPASGRRDIEMMLRSVQDAADSLGLAIPRKPWLDHLADIIDLDSLHNQHGAAHPLVILGLQDEPEQQRQSVSGFDPDVHGSLSLVGTSGAGKSSALRTLAVSASRSAAAFPTHIHAIDFAGGALSSLTALPTVGSVISGDDHERVQRLVRQLTAEAAERAARYSAVSASTLTEYRSITGDTTEPRVFILIDGIANFRAAYEYRQSDDTFQLLLQLISTGRQIGMHFAITADRPGVIPSTMAGNIQLNMVLRMASVNDYGIVGAPSDIFEDAPSGRSHVDGHEMQLAVVGGSPGLAEQAAAILKLGDSLRAQGVEPTPQIEQLSNHIPLSSLPARSDGRPVIGVADEGLRAVDMAPEGLLVVTGPFRSGKTTTLKTLIQAVTSLPGTWDTILITPRSSSELTAGYKWTRSSFGAADSEPFLRGLAHAIDSSANNWPHEGNRGLIVVERSADFEGSLAEGAVAALIKAARLANVLIVVESDLTTGPGAWQIYSELKTARAGIVLQPEDTDGISLFRVTFPRGSRSEFPEGRGYFVEDGRASKFQVALPNESSDSSGTLSS